MKNSENLQNKMDLENNFFDNEELSMISDFKENGFIVSDVQNMGLLNALSHEVTAILRNKLNLGSYFKSDNFLDLIHEYVKVSEVNALRLDLYRQLNSKEWFRPSYYKMGSKVLNAIVGNELAMQNRINLSIQMPNDNTSLLDIHADVFAGESPYQVVQWLPLVDVYKTKSMFIVPKKISDSVVKDIARFENVGMSAIFKEIESEIIWLDIPYGKVLIFSPNILHGNVCNRENETRWSLNCRFKGLLTPYGTPEKSLGSFYSPITARLATQIGIDYIEPSGFLE